MVCLSRASPSKPAIWRTFLCRSPRGSCSSCMLRFAPLPRSAEPELLDAPTHDLAALADNMRDLRTLDRYLGGTALTWQALWPLLRALPPGTTASLLDVA